MGKAQMKQGGYLDLFALRVVADARDPLLK